jgi:peptidoglycan/LPS O-acetylase OafA/YrhL
MLASVDEMVPRPGPAAACGWAGGFAGIFGLLEMGPIDSLRAYSRRPADAALRLHRSWAGRGEPAGVRFGLRPLVFVGEASYCLYLLHFNLWN